MLIDIAGMEEERRAREILSRGLRDLPNPIDDARLPAPDVMGILADYQIHKPQLDEIAREVHENWPGVCAVHAGHYPLSNQTYFQIQIDPFSRELQRHHWALGDKIESIIGTNKLHYFFLPRMEENPSEIRVYKRE